MGQEAERGRRLEAFGRYQVNERVVAFARPGAGALPAGASRGGDHRRRARRAAERGARPVGEPAARPEGRPPPAPRERLAPGRHEPAEEDRPRVLGRAGHLGDPGLAQGDLRRRDRGLHGRPRSGRGADPGPREGHADRRELGAHSISGKSSSATSCSRAAGQRHLRGGVLGTSFARPLIAKAQVAVARAEGADAVAHGRRARATTKCASSSPTPPWPPSSGDRPWRDWDLRSRTDLMAYAQRHGIPVPTTPARPYSMDRNLFHISYEGGILEDPWAEPRRRCSSSPARRRRRRTSPPRSRSSSRPNRWRWTASGSGRWRSSSA